MHRKSRISSEDLITMTMVGAVISALAIVSAVLVRAPESPFVGATQLQTSLAGSSVQ